MRVGQLDELGEVGQRAGEAVDLVDDDDIDAAVAHGGEQALEGGTLEGAPGVSAIVIAFGQEPPALMGLAPHVGFGGLALVVERVELLLQPVLGGHSGRSRSAAPGGRPRGDAVRRSLICAA